MSRGYYYGYQQWNDGLLEGRCELCGYQRSVTVGTGKSFEFAAIRLAERWRDSNDGEGDH